MKVFASRSCLILRHVVKGGITKSQAEKALVGFVSAVSAALSPIMRAPVSTNL
jgi:hypothetical protein